MAVWYEFFVSFRYLRARRRDAFISLITLMSMGGVAIGVMTLNIVLSVMTGFENDLRDRILGFNPHLVLMRYGSTIEEHETVLAEIRATPGVEAAAPVVQGQAMVSANRGMSGVLIRGADPDSARMISDLEEYLTVGRVEDLGTSRTVTFSVDGEEREVDLPGIIIGLELGRQLGVFPGDPVTILSPEGTASPIGMVPKMKRFVVVGLLIPGCTTTIPRSSIWDSRMPRHSWVSKDRCLASRPGSPIYTTPPRLVDRSRPTSGASRFAPATGRR
jgi:lipoprotein-releasing system permease protein